MAYPTTLDTDNTLYVTVNNLFTTLASAYTTPAVTLSLTDASGFPATGGVIYVEGERGFYTGKSSNDLTGVTGVGNNHAGGVTVEMLADSAHHNVLKDALLAVETHIGITGSAVAGTVEKRLTDAIASIPTLTATAAADLGTVAATGVASTGARADHVHSGTVADNAFGIKGSADATKIVRFEVDGLTTATTRTVTVPDATTTMVGHDVAQTLTNKTIALGSNTVSGTLAQFNSAVSDADLASLAGAETLGSKTLTSVKETRTAPTISGGTLTLDLSTANVFDVSLNAAITTLTISNVAASGTAHGFVLTFTADGTPRSVTWGASVLWPSATAPTLTSTNAKKDKFVFMTTDGGTTWHAFVAGQNL